MPEILDVILTIIQTILFQYTVSCSSKIRELKNDDKEIVYISEYQVEHFLGNTIELINNENVNICVMSATAYSVLTDEQKNIIEKYDVIVPVDVFSPVPLPFPTPLSRTKIPTPFSAVTLIVLLFLTVPESSPNIPKDSFPLTFIISLLSAIELVSFDNIPIPFSPD